VTAKEKAIRAESLLKTPQENYTTNPERPTYNNSFSRLLPHLFVKFKCHISYYSVGNFIYLLKKKVLELDPLIKELFEFP
jgi:hypothetical protein